MAYLLYIDTEGNIFLENNSRKLHAASPASKIPPNIFQLGQDRAPLLITGDTVLLDGFLSRKILRDGDDENNQDWNKGKLTIFIVGAVLICCK